MIHIVKSFSIVNEAEADIFLEFSCFFYDPTDVGNLISGSSAFSKFEKMLTPWKQSYDKPRQYIKKQRYHSADKDLEQTPGDSGEQRILVSCRPWGCKESDMI